MNVLLGHGLSGICSGSAFGPAGPGRAPGMAGPGPVVPWPRPGRPDIDRSEAIRSRVPPAPRDRRDSPKLELKISTDSRLRGRVRAGAVPAPAASESEYAESRVMSPLRICRSVSRGGTERTILCRCNTTVQSVPVCRHVIAEDYYTIVVS